MKTLSDTLLAAQKKADRLPYVEAKIYDFEQGIKRLHWTRLYQGTEPDNHHGMAFDGQGSMHRIRAEGSNLYRQKITNPGPSSDYSQWTLIATDCSGPCAIAACGAKVYIFYRKTDNTIRKYYSHNYGVDWTNAELSTYANVLSLAAAWWATGNIVVCFAAISWQLNAIVLNTDTQAASEYTHHEPANHPLLNTYGIGVTYEPDHMAIIFAGKQDVTPYDFYTLFRTQLSNTYTWMGWEYFITSPEGAGITYEYPECHIPSSAADYEQVQIAAVEKFTGSAPYTLPLACHAVRGSAFSEMAYTEPKPFLDISSDYGLRITSNADYWWLERPDGVWRAPRAVGTPLDLTSDIVALTQRVGEGLVPSLAIELDNHKGQYATPPEKRSEVVLKLGYRTSPPTWEAATPYAEGDIIVPTAGKETGFFYECTTAGTSHATTEPTWPTVLGETVVDNTVVWTCHSPNEASQAGVYWIDGWEYSSTPNRSLFTLHCVDGGGLGARWSARYQMRWNQSTVSPKTVSHIIAALLCRWGIYLYNAGKPRSSPLDNFYPDFVVQPGTGGDTAIRRLLSMIPDGLVYEGYKAYTKDPRSDESSSYSYGTDHAILKGEYATAVPISRVRSLGRDADDNKLLSSAFDWDLLALAIDNFRTDYDPNLENATRAQERADAILRTESLRAERGNLLVPVNCGQELYDIITLTDERCGISSNKYRVAAIQTNYDRSRRIYQQKLTIGAP